MKLGVEVKKMHQDRLDSGFYFRFMSGRGLDIGYRGMEMDPEMTPVLESAQGIDLDTPGYDGIHLPHGTESLDYIFASHVLEHIPDPTPVLQEWHRVLKIGGHLVLLLPHAYLYEKALKVGGHWGACLDHKRIYTPSSLLREIETALIPNSYRIVHFRDNDRGYDYSHPPHEPVRFFDDCFEIECVLRKRDTPSWRVE